MTRLTACLVVPSASASSWVVAREKEPGGKGAQGKNVDGAGAERRTRRELSDPS